MRDEPEEICCDEAAKGYGCECREILRREQLAREADAEAAFWAPDGRGSILLGFGKDEEGNG